MRKVKLKERERSGNIYCPYCKPLKVDAIWRKDGFADNRCDFACDSHKHKITNDDENYLTEADLQTWARN